MRRHPSVRLLWRLFEAGCRIALAPAIAGAPLSPWLFASLGDSAVFLFGLARAPAVQSRALLGANEAVARAGRRR